MKNMNKFTYRELEKVQHLISTNWDNNTTHIIINPNLNRDRSEIGVGETFTIRVENYIINQPPNFTLSEDWNNGTIPPEEILDIEVIQTMGKMTKVKAIGKCTKIYWEGWLPNKSFNIQ